jgi:hypothetical protein
MDGLKQVDCLQLHHQGSSRLQSGKQKPRARNAPDSICVSDTGAICSVQLREFANLPSATVAPPSLTSSFRPELAKENSNRTDLPRA